MQWSKRMRLFAAVMMAIALTLSVIGFVVDTAAGSLLLIGSALFCSAVGMYLRFENRKIQSITEQMDKVLHNEEHTYISDSDEGTLSVLESEIVKMTQRIREQNNTLKREKEHLADSLADIAHQLRTPLTSVNLVLSFIETSEEPEERKKCLREANELLCRMDALLSALLKLSRIDAGVIELKPEDLLVSRWVERALSPLQIALELHNIQVIQIIPHDAMIVGDIIWLAEALQNILKNCMESIGDEGRIDITCEDNQLYTLVTVRDSAKGFRAEDIPHLFERFYRGKNTATAGFGIGLALAQTIIVRHGGQITAENATNGGAIFAMKFYK